VVSFTPQLLYPMEREPGTQWIGEWVCPTPDKHAVVTTKIPDPARNLNYSHPAISLITMLT